jgi:GTPase SAR1 family protein
MVYSVADAETCDSMGSWNEITKEHGPEDAIRVLVGNKCDLEEYWEVPTSRGEELGKRMGIPFFETSAKEGRNIETVFRSVITKMLVGSELGQDNSKAAVTALARRRSSQASRVGHSRKCSIV